MKKGDRVRALVGDTERQGTLLLRNRPFPEWRVQWDNGMVTWIRERDLGLV
jgi:hypothetical protein